MASATVVRTETAPSTTLSRFYINTKYTLPADEGEYRRLESQHELLLEIFDGRLICPDVTMRQGARILDNATGTGVWALDASRRFPSASIDAVDISTRLWPQSPPSNVTFAKESLLALPAEWTGRFDFINQRLLMCAFTRADWTQCLSEMFRVTAPGGCVQLGEYSMDFKEGPAGLAHHAVRDAMYGKRNIFIDCAEDLAEMACIAGFDRVTELRKRVRLGTKGGRLGRAMTENMREVYLAMKTPMFLTGAVKSEEEAVKLTTDLVNEWDEIDCWATFVVVWGYKSF